MSSKQAIANLAIMATMLNGKYNINDDWFNKKETLKSNWPHNMVSKKKSKHNKNRRK